MNMNFTTNLVVLDLTAACNGLTVNGVTLGYSGAPTPDVEIVLQEIVSWVSSVGNCFIPYLTGLKYDEKIVVF